MLQIFTFYPLPIYDSICILGEKAVSIQSTFGKNNEKSIENINL